MGKKYKQQIIMTQRPLVRIECPSCKWENFYQLPSLFLNLQPAASMDMYCGLCGMQMGIHYSAEVEVTLIPLGKERD